MFTPTAVDVAAATDTTNATDATDVANGTANGTDNTAANVNIEYLLTDLLQIGPRTIGHFGNCRCAAYTPTAARGSCTLVSITTNTALTANSYNVRTTVGRRLSSAMPLRTRLCEKT